MADERRTWSRQEVEAVVADYFDMLEQELRGESFNKTAHRRRLRESLDGRSDGSVEYKHQNISAVLTELGVPPIDGYKPASNYQDLLFEVVEERLRGAEGLLSVLADEVHRAAAVPTVDDILSRLVSVPQRDERTLYRAGRDRTEVRPSVPNYLLREARNTSLGLAGEEFVLNYETARLVSEGHERLASRIEHVSRTRGDHEGYDVLSFDADGRERLIEVKTTSFGRYTPFYVSSNQVRRSAGAGEQYQVYRLFRFRKDPHLFRLAGAIEQSCDLEASEYVARLA